MRQVMADVVAEASMLITRPFAEQYTLKIPEANDNNIGKTGLIGVAERIWSQQSLEVEINKSGDYIDDFTTGAYFKVKPNFLLDENGNSVVDINTGWGDTTPNWLGTEGPWQAHFLQMVKYGTATNEKASLKVKELKKWKYADDDYGYNGLMFWIERAASNNIYPEFRRMKERGPNATSPGYVWEEITHDLPEGSDWNSPSYMPTGDFVELDDGSLIIALLYTNSEIGILRSFDCGETWVSVSSFYVSYAGRNNIALDRIGNRLIFVYAWDTGTQQHVETMYSDDNGLNWSSAVVIHEDLANSVTTELRVQLIKGQDKVLYICYTTNTGASDGAGVQWTLDGATWSSSGVEGGSAQASTCLAQMIHGQWLYFATKNTEDQLHMRYGESGGKPYNWAASGGLKYFLPDIEDSDGMIVKEVYVCSFSGAFIDVVVMFEDTHGTTYRSIAVFRCYMWSPLFLEQHSSNQYIFDSCWLPHAYPSTSDGHPNLNHWTRTLSGSATSTLIASSDGYLRTATFSSAENAYYDQDATLPTNMWDTGLVAQFTLRVNSGYAHVEGRLCSNPSNGDTHWTVIFEQSADRVLIYDKHASMAAVSDIPSNWSVDDEWNRYMIVAIDQRVYVYRAPFDYYKEIIPWQLICKYETLQKNAYSADNDSLKWGVIAGSGASQAWWKEFFLNYTDDCNVNPSGTSMPTVNVGKTCTQEFGTDIMQGFGAKWAGSFAVSGDAWELLTGALYEADNVFIHSPRIQWRSPRLDADTADSNDYTFEWRREDEDGEEMNFVFDSIAMFGLNASNIKLYGANYDGSGETLLFNSMQSQDHTGPQVWEGVFEVTAIDNNIVTFDEGTTDLNVWPFENQLASNQFRNFYVFFTSGSCAGRHYKIIGNENTKLHLECNVEADGVAASDDFTIISDRFFWKFSQVYNYPRLKLVVDPNSVGIPSPSERNWRIGTVVIGRTYQLPDDEWSSDIVTEPAVDVRETRSRVRQWRELGPERRSISLTYTGLVDRGMGSHVVSKLWEHLRWGVSPVVWIDDDSILGYGDGSASDRYHCHPDPILARVRGPIVQGRVAYNYLEQDGKYYTRNIQDLSGVILEEEL